MRMTLSLYAHPFSSYSQKVLIALWEHETPFAYRNLEDPAAGQEFAALWPFGTFPVLVDNGAVIGESSIIIEHIDATHARAERLIPQDHAKALEVRFMDRFFDLHVMAPMQGAVMAHLTGDATRAQEGLAIARKKLETAYVWLNARLLASGGPWATGSDFTMADCAAAPSLFYADWVHSIGAHCPAVATYRTGLLARPSVARAVEEARPYRHYFPLGAPDRD
jgi:glutathione S-transferase